MAGDKIRVGLIGANVQAGWSHRSHIPALLGLPEYELAAVCTAHKKTAEQSAKQFGVPQAYHDYRKMVENPDIDLVTVSVRVPFHHEMVMAALNAGKHVFCEWPLGANLKEAEEMAALARSKGVRTMVGLQARGAPSLLHLRELLAEGYVGEIVSSNMTMFSPGILRRDVSSAWQADNEKGATTFTISGGHTIDAFCFCAGEFKEVSSKVSTQVPVWETSEPGKTVNVTAPDNILVSGVLTNGAVASVHVASIPWHGTGWRMAVYGREGTVVASSEQMVQLADTHLVQGLHGGDTALQELKPPDRLTRIPGEVPRGEARNVAQMYRHLSESIQQGKAADADFDLAAKRHRTLDAIQRSSDQGVKAQVS